MTSLQSKFKRSLIAQLGLFYIFMASGLITNFLQLLTLTIWPFNKKLYRKLNIYLAYGFWANFTWLAQHWSNSTCDLYIKEEDFKFVGKEHAIVICNHKYDVDWLMGWIICQKTGLLFGSKIIGKSSLRYVPLIGWCWIFAESIFIKRKWDVDKNTLTRDLNAILEDYPENHFFNILIYCEGTRFTVEKHEDSMRVAKEKGLPELKHHLLPRTKGFCLLARGAAGKIDAVYDLTVGIEQKNGDRADFNKVRNGEPVKSELFVRRIAMKDIPTDEEGASNFIHKMYQEKDKIFDVYDKTGSFKALGVKQKELEHNYYDYYIVLGWSLLLLPPLVYYLLSVIVNATLMTYSVMAAVLLVAKLCMKLFVSVTQAKAGSKYGLEQKNK